MDDVMVIVTFLFYAAVMGVPLLMGTAGEIITEKSGSLNLGVEGMMAMGAICGYLIAATTNSLILGILGSFLGAGAGALIYAFLTVTLKANQNVTGLALTIFGVGFCQFIGETLHDQLKIFPSMSESLKTSVANTGIPVLCDIPVIGKLLFSYNSLLYIAVAIAIVCWIYIRFTRSGLKLNAIGENPGAADAVGVNITKYKYMHIVLGGGITGIGGLYLAMVVNSGAWDSNWINGFGWISIALVIFSNWSTARAIFGSFFFGLLITLQAWAGNLAGAFPDGLGWLQKVPVEFYQMLPFLITALVLIVTSATQRKSQSGPAAIGLSYYREDR